MPNFHFQIINFKLECMLFHVNKRQFYEGHFRNRVNESTNSRIVTVFTLNIRTP